MPTPTISLNADVFAKLTTAFDNLADECTDNTKLFLAQHADASDKVLATFVELDTTNARRASDAAESIDAQFESLTAGIVKSNQALSKQVAESGNMVISHINEVSAAGAQALLEDLNAREAKAKKAAKKTAKRFNKIAEGVELFIPSEEELDAKAREAAFARLIASATPEEFASARKAMDAAEWAEKDWKQQSMHYAKVAAPLVATAVLAGAGGYYLAGGFSSESAEEIGMTGEAPNLSVAM